MRRRYKTVSGEEFQTREMDNRIREYILKYLKEKELIRHESNVIYSEKVFIISAVLRWCLEKMQKKQMSAYQWSKNRKIIAQYIAGTVDIVWLENNFKTIEVESNENKVTRGQKRRTTKRRKDD